jgi:hypothetical protein
MDQKQLAREILAVKDPACLQGLLVCHGDQFGATAARALKERVDEVNRADPRQALALAEAGLLASEIGSDPIARAWMLWARAHTQMQLEDYQSGLVSCDAALESREESFIFLPTSPHLEYLVQVVDSAGNVAVDDNGGFYYHMPDTHKVHLPLVLRCWP